MLRATRSPPSSGSWTVRRASRTAASEMALIGWGFAPVRRVGSLTGARPASHRTLGRPRTAARRPARATAARRASDTTGRHTPANCRDHAIRPANLAPKPAESGSVRLFDTPPARPYRAKRWEAARGGLLRPAPEDVDPRSANIGPAAAGASPPVNDVDVRLVQVTKAYGDALAVDHIDLDVVKGEFFSLLGPSGCGKTTTLRMIGGFEQPTSGLIELKGQDVTWLPPYQRNVNTVFQNYALFPHLTIYENVAFGLRRKGVKDSEVKSRVTQMLELVELPGFEQPQAQPDLRRPGAARRARAGAHQPARRPAPRRAARRARPQAAQADADRAEAHPAGGRDHVHVRDPRPGRGDDDVRPHRRDEQGQVRTARRPGDALRAADDPLRGRLPGRQQPAAPHGRRRDRRLRRS